MSPRNLFPPLLWPLFAAALHRPRGHRASAGARGAPTTASSSSPTRPWWPPAWPRPVRRSGIIDVRFVPFAQLALAVLGAAAVGLAVQALAASELAALGLVILAVLHGDHRSRVLRYWIEWNYTGLEAKELWPAFRELAQRLPGTVADPRVAVEYGTVHERAGSIRMYETTPALLRAGPRWRACTTRPACRPTSSTTWPPSWARPRRTRSAAATYSTFDPEAALDHLRLFNVSDVVAVSPQLVSALRARDDVEPLASIPPYEVFRLAGPRPRYVEPMAFAPVRSSPRGWRDKAWRWFTRKPLGPAHLVFTEDGRFPVAEPPDDQPPPAVPLEPGVTIDGEEVGAEAIRFRTSRSGPSGAGARFVPPAMAGGGRGRPVPRLARVDDGRAAAA